MVVKRGEIYYADLGMGEGSEQAGTRPALVVGNNIGNKYSPTVIVAPITSQKKKSLPTHIKVSSQSGLTKDSTVMFEQVRTIDKTRLKSRVGSIDDKKMLEADKVIAVTFGMSFGIANSHGMAMSY